MHGQHFEGKQTGNSLDVSTLDREKCFHLNLDASVVTRKSFGLSHLFDLTANKRHSVQCKPGQDLDVTPQRPLQRLRTESITGHYTVASQDLQEEGLFWSCRPTTQNSDN